MEGITGYILLLGLDGIYVLPARLLFASRLD